MRWRLEAELLAAGDAVAAECWSLLLGLCAEAAATAGDAAGDAVARDIRAAAWDSAAAVELDGGGPGGIPGGGGMGGGRIPVGGIMDSGSIPGGGGMGGGGIPGGGGMGVDGPGVPEAASGRPGCMR